MDANPELPAKTCADSAVGEQVYMVFPNDLNSNDTVFGGVIMAHIDRLAVVVADRHAGGVTVTVSVDTMHFLLPAVRGDILVMHASVNRAWRSSMELGVRVEAESIGSRERRHILSAYLTFVALDDNGKPRAVPQLIAETPNEKRRFAEADLRRASRLQHTEQLQALRGRPTVE